jgi:Fe-coproporphyrin III synthase
VSGNTGLKELSPISMDRPEQQAEEKLKRKTVAFSKNAVNVFFHILTACNLKCRHCYINPDQHGHKPLEIAAIRRWLECFVHKRDVANVVFLGGEPTLHPDLPEAIRYARHLGYHSITVDTNGYLFHDFLDQVTPGEVDFISFSLDGVTPGTNDALRGEGSWDRCTEGIRNAVARGFSVSLIYTVSGANIEELPRMPNLLKTLGVHRFFIQVIGIRGKSVQEKETVSQLTREDWLEVVPRTAEATAGLGIPTVYPKVFLDASDVFECAGNVAENYFIFPNGRVYRCPLCEDFPLHSYEIINGGLSPTGRINETDLFSLTIPEGCVMNKLVQPDNLEYDQVGLPRYRIACCLLKKEILPLVE